MRSAQAGGRGRRDDRHQQRLHYGFSAEGRPMSVGVAYGMIMKRTEASSFRIGDRFGRKRPTGKNLCMSALEMFERNWVHLFRTTSTGHQQFLRRFSRTIVTASWRLSPPRDLLTYGVIGHLVLEVNVGWPSTERTEMENRGGIRWKTADRKSAKCWLGREGSNLRMAESKSHPALAFLPFFTVYVASVLRSVWEA
jgi:hypothetical protein